MQAFDLFDRLDTKSAKKSRIRKNSLLNSLFSGNLPPGVHPYRETQNKEQVALEAPVRASAGQTARYDSNFGNASARSDAISAAAAMVARSWMSEYRASAVGKLRFASGAPRSAAAGG